MDAKRENRPASSTSVDCSPGMSRPPGCDFGLEAQIVAADNAGFAKGLAVEQLLAGALVVELVAHDLPIGAVDGQVHALHENDEQARDRHVVGGFDDLAAAARHVPHSCG